MGSFGIAAIPVRPPRRRWRILLASRWTRTAKCILRTAANASAKWPPPLPGFSGQDLAIPSDDGAALYQFTAAGRHLRTLNALTGSVIYQFGYDSAGRLSQVQDGDGNVTTIERVGSGNPTALAAPDGQRTLVTLDANGYLAGVTNPAGESTQFASTSDGLLTGLTDPRTGLHQFTYDAQGRLIKDDDPAGGFSALAR